MVVFVFIFADLLVSFFVFVSEFEVGRGTYILCEVALRYM